MTDAVQADEVPLDKLARVYRKIQGRIQELTAEYDKEVAQLTAQRDAVRNELKDRLLAMGVKSANTAHGTVILGVQTRFHAQDWDAFKQFMLQHDALDLVEKRISQKNMAQFLEANPALVPPGLNSNSEYIISVRKPSK